MVHVLDKGRFSPTGLDGVSSCSANQKFFFFFLLQFNIENLKNLLKL